MGEIIKDGMSEYDKEKAVYDYVFSQTHFNDDSLVAISDDSEDDESYNPYGFSTTTLLSVWETQQQ